MVTKKKETKTVEKKENKWFGKKEVKSRK